MMLWILSLGLLVSGALCKSVDDYDCVFCAQVLPGCTACSVRQVNCSGIQLIEFPRFDKVCNTRQGVQSLVLANNNLQTIPDYAFNVTTTKLLTLDLSGNDLREFPEQILTLKVLKKLNLANNWIGRLPAGLDALDTLVEINLSGNAFSQVPAEICKPQVLQTISFDGNPISADLASAIPIFAECHRLYTLYWGESSAKCACADMVKYPYSYDTAYYLPAKYRKRLRDGVHEGDVICGKGSEVAFIGQFMRAFKVGDILRMCYSHL